jgi:hypothetical protein
MRSYRLVVALAAALSALLVFASTAAAGPAPMWPVTTAPPVPKAPASALVVKTAAMLPAAGYPWVQPLFLGAYPTLRAHIHVSSTQPPATIPTIVA